MQEIIRLLNDKNGHLEKFLNFNEIELMNFFDGHFENLDHFYQAREVILNIISRIDELVEEAQDLQEDNVQITDQQKREILQALEKKNNLVTEILSLDLQILSAIEAEKSRIIKDLSQVKMAKKAMKGYRSKSKTNRLDEEA